MHEDICDSTFVTFEESNHYPFLEEAAQFTSTTQTFYKSLVPLLLRKPKH